ncbi:putative serine/threonine-protein kinase a, putative,protein kinase [Trypanosoma conorhini]|uniref:non-specific serine/threonine protein kinase n=1 Tax=Trypanosoma conorhini TaxID=83891 RepID=A0A3R7PLY9_9TRYP|nr:putative serine/threonine-protein kinase a, putative,protein kinase [Trypanosoma conorhini]RNF27342.1 putative serine/threonine-protein kinase a, putative,protein kinase [Trypanosoma conorhini]
MTDAKRVATGNSGLPQPPTEGDTAKSDPLEGILGTRPDCKYIKKKLLGQGSFGSAWRVEERETGTIYAAKVMDTNNMSSKDRGFVTNEVKCLSRCNNANIVRHHVSYERGGMLLIIMEYADGGDLYKQIKARQQSTRYFKEHEVLFIFLQLCLALDHIHMNKMMHRDLKTANVLLTTTGLVKLGDFGFSRQYEDSLSNPVGSTFCGTPYYLSPELWRRAPYSKKSEMWALGVVLYEVIALKRPFGGRNMDELIDNILHARRQPLPSIYSEDIRNVCDQLLSLDPKYRPSLRQLFQQPFIRKGLETLRRSVLNHNRIPQSVQQEIARNVDEVLSSDIQDYESSRVVPRRGVVARHTADRGWQECDLSLDEEAIVMRDVATGSEERVELSAVTSVCPIDAAIAHEKFVFAMKNQTGKAFWFKEANETAYEEWLVALQNALPG